MILNTISLLATVVVIFMVLNFLWKISSQYLLFLRKKISGIHVYKLFSITTTITMIFVFDINFYTPW